MATRSETAPVLVLGGTGHYGRHIVASLLRRGEPVRVLSRNAAKARKLLGEGPGIVAGDVTARRSAAESLAGARAVVISLSAFTPKLIRKLKLIERDAVLAVIEEAQQAGISRVVYISVYDVRQDVLRELDLDLETARIKLEIESVLAGSDLDWTVLGSPPSMEIFFAMVRGNRMVVPGGGPPALPTVSPVDVGEIAAEAAARNDLGGRRIRMTGPEALSFPEAARRISAVWGREISYRKIPLLPLRIASVVTRPVNPFLGHMLAMVRLMNGFPQDLAAEVPADHGRLVETFHYTPTTLEMEARRRIGPDSTSRANPEE